MNAQWNVKRIVTLLIIIVSLVLVACGAAAAEPAVEEAVEAEEAQSEVGGVASSEADKVEAGHDDAGAVVEAEEAAPAEEEAMAEEPAAAAPDSDFAAAGAAEESRTNATAAPLPTMTAAPAVVDEQFVPFLQAGEIDDNQEYGEYLQYKLDYLRFASAPVHEVDISERHIVKVVTSNGKPVLGAEVLFYDGQDLLTTLRTTAHGTVYFFPKAYTGSSNPINVLVRKGQNSAEFQITRGSSDTSWEVALGARPTEPPVNLDVMLLIDATGSMESQIEQLKNNILSISAQVAALPSRPNLRFGMVSYRDQGDEYVTRVTDFTPNVDDFQSELMGVFAMGGGDTPEALNEGLHSAIWNVDWRVDDTVSLMILVADAPPHIDEPGYGQSYDYAQEMRNAASLGIKIYPIIADTGNVEDYYRNQAEFVYRQIAQFTGGHFIFVTSEETPQSSGEQGTDLSVQEEDYTVENLDALVVRLIQEELAALTGQ
jgi:hypothetical protein